VNSTLASAQVATKLSFRVDHVEAGLRSYDRAMPEEINRVLTAHVFDLLLMPSRDANVNLRREGVLPEWIRFVGSIMIDTLLQLLPKAETGG
jgi:UDP-N-acetylglucosamine 2-epimerase